MSKRRRKMNFKAKNMHSLNNLWEHTNGKTMVFVADVNTYMEHRLTELKENPNYTIKELLDL